MRFIKSWLLVSFIFAAAALAQTPQTTLPLPSPIGKAGVDFCADRTIPKVVVPINQSAAGPTTILAGVAGKSWYVCYLMLHNGTNATPQNVGLVEGTGTNCSVVSAGLYGGTTAATQPNMAGAEMLIMGNGLSTILVTATAGDNICYLAGGTTQFSGVIVAVNY